ncbi:hypothetical protein [Kingella potus]|nr:hypothetical protein [Kingella potus]
MKQINEKTDAGVGCAAQATHAVAECLQNKERVPRLGGKATQAV